jgi:hypothetical protein
MYEFPGNSTYAELAAFGNDVYRQSMQAAKPFFSGLYREPMYQIGEKASRIYHEEILPRLNQYDFLDISDMYRNKKKEIKDNIDKSIDDLAELLFPKRLEPVKMYII